MPTNPDLGFAIAFGDAYFARNGEDLHLSRFADLCEAVGVADVFAAIRAARTSGRLTEGAHVLPPPVSDFLISIGKGPLVLRQWPVGKGTSSCGKHSLQRIAGVLPSEKAEEVEAWDSAENWYLRFRDDDPFIFLALPTISIERLIVLSPDNCRQVEGNFVYAL